MLNHSVPIGCRRNMVSKVKRLIALNGKLNVSLAVHAKELNSLCKRFEQEYQGFDAHPSEKRSKLITCIGYGERESSAW